MAWNDRGELASRPAQGGGKGALALVLTLALSPTLTLDPDTGALGVLACRVVLSRVGLGLA